MLDMYSIDKVFFDLLLSPYIKTRFNRIHTVQEIMQFRIFCSQAKNISLTFKVKLGL